jgi:hypothetical protein
MEAHAFVNGSQRALVNYRNTAIEIGSGWRSFAAGHDDVVTDRTPAATVVEMNCSEAKFD